jgi:hypothetical protein
MLALDTPLLGSGHYFSNTGTTSGEIFSALSATETEAVIGPDALARTISKVRRACTPDTRNDDTPTGLACQTAEGLLAEAQTIAPIYFAASVIEGSEGDLLIHWDAPSKSVVLICPKDAAAQASLYKETLAGIKPIRSELARNASAQLLSEALTWVLQPIQ